MELLPNTETSRVEREQDRTLALQHVGANLVPPPQDTELPSVSVFRERALCVPTPTH